MDDDFIKYRRRLPHWRLPRATYFVTWRLAPGTDSLTGEERTVVVDALKFFDDDRYILHAFVVMNDHVHVLVEPRQPLSFVVHTWKSFTANQLQRRFGRAGVVWQDEYFDRVVRDDAEFEEKRLYIAANPSKRWPTIDSYAWAGCRRKTTA